MFDYVLKGGSIWFYFLKLTPNLSIFVNWNANELSIHRRPNIIIFNIYWEAVWRLYSYFFCSEFEWEESEGLWSIHLANFLSGPTQQPCITWTHWLAKQDMREGGRKSTRKRERERERKGVERLREWEWHISIMRERKKSLPISVWDWAICSTTSN